MPEHEMTRAMYGPDITFAGVPRTSLEILDHDAGYDIVFVGAPFGSTLTLPSSANGVVRTSRSSVCASTISEYVETRTYVPRSVLSDSSTVSMARDGCRSPVPR